MAQRWLVYEGADDSAWLSDVVRAVDPGAHVDAVSSAHELRRRLRESEDGMYSAALHGTTDVEPVNLCAALVKDGFAREVLLIVDETSGSLRSRASAAGVSRVLSREEAEIRLRAAAGSIRAGMSAPGSDIDEPDACEKNPDPEFAAPIIALASGRGGVGKSSIAAAMAMSASTWGMRVALVDMDLSFGNLFGYFGLNGPVDFVSMLKDGSCDFGSGRQVMPNLVLYGPCAKPEYAETITPHVADVLSAVSDDCDLVIVDTASCWGEAAARVVQLSDRVLLTCDERAGALGSLTRSGALAVRLGVARTRIVRLMNRCDSRRRDETFLARADMGLETARSMRVLDGGSDVAELLSSGHAKDLLAEDSVFVQSCACVIAKLLAELGKLPKDVRAQKARDMKEPRPRGLALFKSAV